MDTTPFQFTYTHPVVLPCGKDWEFEYVCEAQAVANYERDDFTGEDYFDGVSFDILSCSLYGVEDVAIWKPGQDMTNFRAALEAKARDIYDKRSGSTDFAEVVVHDRVEGVAVRVVETIQLTSKAA